MRSPEAPSEVRALTVLDTVPARMQGHAGPQRP